MNESDHAAAPAGDGEPKLVAQNQTNPDPKIRSTQDTDRKIVGLKIREIRPQRDGRGAYWYRYTDPSGSQWLIEAYPDKEVQPAKYDGGL